MAYNRIPEFQGFGISHIGRIRQRNEDRIYVHSRGRYALIADGMGGHNGGKEASRIAINDIVRFLKDSRQKLYRSDDKQIRSEIARVLKDCALNIFKQGNENPELNQMGTTIVMWLQVGPHIYIAWAGDSRAYLIRDSKIFQVTIDHCLMNEQLKLGASRKNISKSPYNDVLVKNLGLYPPSEPSVIRCSLKKGDQWLLCSDGLSGKVKSLDLLNIYNSYQSDPVIAAQQMVDLAWKRGGEDNISVILMTSKKGLL